MDAFPEKRSFEGLAKDMAFDLNQIEAEQKERGDREKLIAALKRSEFLKDLLAHDMKNIINNIKSSLKLMEIWNIELSDSPKKREFVDIIKSQLERGESLICTVNKSSNIPHSNPKPLRLNINTALRQALRHIKEEFEEETIETNLLFPQHCRQLFVKGGSLLNVAFENILRNAVIHNNNKVKKIWIVVSVSEKHKGFVKIEFQDNGVGITDKRKEMVFKRWNPPSKGANGMGIGLSLVKKIISDYNGKIWVEDRIKGKPEQGSNFIVLVETSEKGI
ncbi:MAG: sensor histidine kinase [Promethearchaeia archaeon]